MAKKQAGSREIVSRDQIAGTTRSEGEMIDLFFRSLFRLGIYVSDCEVWYGTKLLNIPGAEPKPQPPRPTHARPARPSR